MSLLVSQINLNFTAGSALAAERKDSAYQMQFDQIAALMNSSHLAKAEPKIRQLLLTYPGKSKLWCWLAQCCIRDMDKLTTQKEARDYVNKAVLLDPDQGSSYLVLSDIESICANWPAAKAAATKAIRARYPDLGAYRSRALTENATKDHKHALADIDQYLAYFPDRENGLRDRAAILESMGDFGAAQKQYHKLLGVHMQDSYVYAEVRCLNKIGHYQESIATLTKLIKANPHDEFALRERAKVLTQTGSYDQAIKDLTLSIDEMPSTNTYRERAALYKKINRLDLFKKDMERAENL